MKFLRELAYVTHTVVQRACTGAVCVCARERERERERVHADCFELLLVNNSSMNHDIRED